MRIGRSLMGYCSTKTPGNLAVFFDFVWRAQFAWLLRPEATTVVASHELTVSQDIRNRDE